MRETAEVGWLWSLVSTSPHAWAFKKYISSLSNLLIPPPSSPHQSHTPSLHTQACLEIAVLSAMVCLMQSIRFNVHAAFALKVAASGVGLEAPAPGALPTRFAAGEALALLDRAAGAFTAGQRCFYAFLPFFMSLFGPTIMLASTLLLVCGLYVLDVLPVAVGLGGARGGGGGGVDGVEGGAKEARAVV